MSDLQIPRIKKTQNVNNFVSMATELPDHQRFYKYFNFKADYLASAVKTMYILYTF